ncbi:MAG: DUF3029 family protein [Ruminococcaceae bacterium]|nr:DUF3029 family protein [Oscillospiraceae bacterium]
MNREELLNFALSRICIANDSDVLRADTEIREFLLKNCDITISKENYFFVRVNCEGIMDKVVNARLAPFHEEIREGIGRTHYKNRALSGLHDFSHTAPLWEDILDLGIIGLYDRVKKHASAVENDEKKKRYFDLLIRFYEAVFSFIERAADKAEKEGRVEMAESLHALKTRKPETLYEALQTIMIYFTMQQHFDGTPVRTLGRLDSLLYRFYEKETKENSAALIEKFILEIDSWEINSNVPFLIGGDDENGDTYINELSYLLLETYKRLVPPNTKMHIMYSEKTPENLLAIAMDSIRMGANSIAFLSDGMIKDSLVKLGISKEDALKYEVVGCYECSAREEISSSCNAIVNVAKAVELALNNGKDILTDQFVGLENNGEFPTFDDFYDEIVRQLENLSSLAMYYTDLYERNYSKIHSSQAFSSTYPSALENGGDIYCDYAAKYNNSSVNAIGLATAVDSLVAVRKLVYEDKKVTLSELREILKNDWRDNEVLRLTVKNKYAKYGMGDKETDTLAADIVHKLYGMIAGKPNVKGGVYRLGTFSIDWRIKYGKSCGASADGRLARAPISQNTGASVGGDRNGVTAHIHSVTEIDMLETVNGSVLDVDLHSSAVKGDDGLCALLGTLKTYFDRGGFAVHYNVLDTNTLRDAVDHPEKYPNLQVRLCGWNALFTTLATDVQKEFIARAEHQEGAC